MNFERIARQLLRALRGSRSQVGFSRRLGYRTNVVYTWESGRRWPTARTMLFAASRSGVDVRTALKGFFRSPPRWIDELDPVSPEGVAALLQDLKGHTPIVDLARRAGRSRFALMRWFSGAAEPRLPDFLALVDAASLRILDFLARFVDPAGLRETAAAWKELQALRRAAYEMPWMPAIVRALELRDYAALDRHEPGWIASRLGIPIEEEARCLDVLEKNGQIRRAGERWVFHQAETVDTRQDPAAERRLKSWWAEVGLRRLDAGSKGLFSFNVFTISTPDLLRLRDLHLAYFRAMRSLVAQSTPGEHVAVANVQLFTLDPWPE